MSDLSLSVEGMPELSPGGWRALSDEWIAKLAARGSERAFATLYERHHQAIYRYCRSIVRNDHDAQEALQSTMMNAYGALRARERGLTLKPWLFRIAHNESISILRRRRPEGGLGEEHELRAAGVEDSLEVRERLWALMADLKMLPERQRAALLMRELSGLSVKQIGTVLGMSTGAVKQALFEARTSLHERSEGRDMQCESVRHTISLRDGRMLRSRRIRAHLQACEECRRFHASMATRRADLAVIAPPLPAAAASGLLGELLGHGAGHATTGAASTALGGHAAASLLGKAIAAVAVVVVAAGTVHLAVRSHHDGRRSLSTAKDARATHDASRAHEIDSLSTPASRAQARPVGTSGTHVHAPGASTGTAATTLGAPVGGQSRPNEVGRLSSGHKGTLQGAANGQRHGHAGQRVGAHSHAPRKRGPRGAGGRAVTPQRGEHRARSRHKREPKPTPRHEGRGHHPEAHTPTPAGSTAPRSGGESAQETGNSNSSGRGQHPGPTHAHG